MHRMESLIMASNLKRMHLDHCTLNVFVPTAKVLEAMVTKKCLEMFHLESLETLGGSFLKYAASIQLFRTYEIHHEGLLTVKNNKIISNAAFCRLGCARKIPFLMSSDRVYSRGKLKSKCKKVADVVEALIGAYLSSGGEVVALSFMKWLGVDMDFVDAPMSRHFPINAEKLVNVRYLENLLHYKFNDPSLLVEALLHGSYMLPEIPRCYQIILLQHIFFKHPGPTPGLITDLRSASINNECCAQSEHILHASQDLQRQIFSTIEDFEKLDLVLGDVIESLDGVIFVDSDFDKDTTFESIRPLLEPLITPHTIKVHPIRELSELSDQNGYLKKKDAVSGENGLAYISSMCSGRDKKMAKKMASKNVLKSLKECPSNS
ncbi:unnamed protein product [Withania somnifera]